MAEISNLVDADDTNRRWPQVMFHPFCVSTLLNSYCTNLLLVYAHNYISYFLVFICRYFFPATLKNLIKQLNIPDAGGLSS